MNIFSRILQFIDYKGISKNKFSNEIGLSNSYMTKMEGSDNVGSKIIEKIVRSYPDINLTWLITGSGDMFLNQNNKNESEPMDCNNCPFKKMADKYENLVDRLNLENERLNNELNSLRHQNQPERKRHSA